jgi:hypothetical protein
MRFECLNKLFTLIVYYKFHKEPSYETKSYYKSPFCKLKHLCRG